MKLNIEQIAPYIPYGLNGLYNIQDVVSSYKNETRNKVLTCDSCTFFLLYCKPILRPMSDLDKPFKIEENIDFYSHLSMLNHQIKKISLSDSQDIDRDLDFELDGTDRSAFYFNAEHGYNAYLFLFEYHFDVFGLIKKGLAVDINTI